MSLSDLARTRWVRCQCKAPTCNRWWTRSNGRWPWNVARFDVDPTRPIWPNGTHPATTPTK